MDIHLYHYPRCMFPELVHDLQHTLIHRDHFSNAIKRLRKRSGNVSFLTNKMSSCLELMNRHMHLKHTPKSSALWKVSWSMIAKNYCNVNL